MAGPLVLLECWNSIELRSSIGRYRWWGNRREKFVNHEKRRQPAALPRRRRAMSNLSRKGTMSLGTAGPPRWMSMVKVLTPVPVPCQAEEDQNGKSTAWAFVLSR